ncbi:MAG TPA: glycosyltransferase family 39 protein, partial [Planctomycetota bacterium]|nr:glycosyltransferase family 39 protein [Planctomycetota bacterium]
MPLPEDAGGHEAPGPDEARGLPRLLWGNGAPRWLLPVASAAVLLVMLGSQTLWTHEGRWAVITREMERSGDYFHPRLFDDDYFDKPLFSYWLMIGAGRLLGGLNEWTLRLPGVLAGLLTIWCTVRLGRLLGSREAGLVAGWMLASCYFFVFWSRLACSDMLNVAAVTAAVTWYFGRRDRPGFATWAVFFAILGVGSLMKGPVAAALAIVAVGADLLSAGRWRIHVRPSMFLGALTGLLGFLLPGVLAVVFGSAANLSSELGAVFRENFVRYFHPFDHADPFYTYAEYLPAYALPWTLLLPFVIRRDARRWKELGASAHWPLLAAVGIFIFLTLGAGRRNYYILPILPLLMLAAADWVCAAGARSRRASITAWTAAVCWSGMILYFGAAVPIAASKGGARTMALEVRKAAEGMAPWTAWEVQLYAVKPQLAFYLDTGTPPHRAGEEELGALVARVRDHPRTIVVTRNRFLKDLEPLMTRSRIVRERSMLPWSLGEFRSDLEG